MSLYFDLGWSDTTAIWFVQHIAGETRLIDFHQDAQRPFSHYLQVLQNRGYVYATMWLPHDAQAKSLGTGRSIEEIARNAGWRVGTFDERRPHVTGRCASVTRPQADAGRFFAFP